MITFSGDLVRRRREVKCAAGVLRDAEVRRQHHPALGAEGNDAAGIRAAFGCEAVVRDEDPKRIGELHGRDDAEDGGDIRLSGRDWIEADAARNRQGAFGDGDQEEDCEAEGGGQWLMNLCG